MGRKCAVPHCYTGYRKCKEKASLYRVPDDDFFLNKWQEAIAREDRPITPKDYVCEKHFTEDDILRRRVIKDVIEQYQRPRLKPDAVPSVFPDLPEFILKMVKKRRKMLVEDPAKKDGEETIDLLKEIDKTDCNENENCQETPGETEPSAKKDQKATENLLETILNHDEIDIKSEIDEVINNSVDDKQGSPNGPKMHHCDECDYKTKYPHNLRTHKSKHLTGDKAYLHCNQCPKFKTKWEMTYRNHLKIKHGIGKQEMFKCTMCQYETKVRLCLRRHYERHSREFTEKKYKCDYAGCDYEVESSALLNIHQLVHNDSEKSTELPEKQKSFRCTECNYETNSKTHIIRHIKSAHSTGDDTVVSVAYKKPTVTVLSESDEKTKSTFKCVKCSYKTHFRTLLLKHIFKHKSTTPGKQKKSEGKIWKCPKCPYSTFCQQALESHMQADCEENMFRCNECSFTSDSKPDYIKHSLTHRNTTVETVTHVEPDCSVEQISNQPNNSPNYQHSDESGWETVKDFDMVTVKEEPYFID